jgi:hypothetical protein
MSAPKMSAKIDVCVQIFCSLYCAETQRKGILANGKGVDLITIDSPEHLMCALLGLTDKKDLIDNESFNQVIVFLKSRLRKYIPTGRVQIQGNNDFYVAIYREVLRYETYEEYLEKRIHKEPKSLSEEEIASLVNLCSVKKGGAAVSSKEVAQKTASRQGNAARDQKKAEKAAYELEVLRIAEIQRKSAVAKLARKKIEKQRAGKVSVGGGSLKGVSSGGQSSEETKESGAGDV